MERVTLSLLRGVCQLPAYVAADLGLFRAHDLDVALEYAPTAWAVPERMVRGHVDFAVIPWTRVAAAGARGEPLVLVCGSGCEEAALVVRHGCAPADVARVALPQEGGMKDLTAVGLVQSLGWSDAETLRLPSGDAAIPLGQLVHDLVTLAFYPPATQAWLSERQAAALAPRSRGAAA